MSNDTSRAAFEEWHRTHGANTQGIKWVDELVESAWQASRKNALEDVGIMATVEATYEELMKYIQGELLK